MKMISIVCNVSVANTILNMLNKFNINNYQHIEEINSKPVIGKPRLNSAIWPGYSSMINFQHQDNNQLKEILFSLNKYNSEVENNSEKIEVYVWKLEDYICK